MNSRICIYADVSGVHISTSNPFYINSAFVVDPSGNINAASFGGVTMVNGNVTANNLAVSTVSSLPKFTQYGMNTSLWGSQDINATSFVGFDSSGNLQRLPQVNKMLSVMQNNFTLMNTTLTNALNEVKSLQFNRNPNTAPLIASVASWIAMGSNTPNATPTPTPAPTPTPTPVPALNPTVLYPFEQNTTETAGGVTSQYVVAGGYYFDQTHPSSYPGSVTYVPGAVGSYGINTTSGAIAANYAFPMTGFTISYWFYPISGYVADAFTLYAGPLTNQGPAIYIGTDSANKFNIYGYNIATGTSTASFSMNTWMHVAMTYTPGTLMCYLNGVYSFSCATTFIPLQAFLIGQTFTDYGATCYFDDFRIYASTLSANQVAAVYGNLTPLPTQTLVALPNAFTYMPLNSSTVDLTGGATSITGTPTSYSKVSGITGFQVVNANNSSATQYIYGGMNLTSTDFTISFWFNAPSFWTNGEPIACWGSPAGGNLQFLFGSGTTSATTINVQLYNGTLYNSTAAAVNANQWYHAVLTFQQTGNAVFYLNNSQVWSMATSSFAFSSGINNFCLGSWVNSTHLGSYNGYFSDFRVYKTALAANQVNVLYNNP